MLEINILKEIEELIPPLSNEEFNLLEQNIIAEGLRESLIVWRKIIPPFEDNKEVLFLIDGHNRYHICNNNNIDYDYKEINFNNMFEAKEWIIKNQLGRRNLTDYDRVKLALRMENLFKEKAKENQGARTDLIEIVENLEDNIPKKSAECFKPIETRQEIAKIAGVSHDTVRKVKKIEEKASLEQKNKLQSREASINEIYKEIKRNDIREKRQMIANESEETNNLIGKYRIIYADPPWAYGNSMPEYFTEQADHYPLMNIKELCELPVIDIALDNAVLFLWVTSPILEESFEVIKSWGFKYKSSFVWDKIKHNMGHYNSVRHELLLICVRGSCQPDVKKLFDSVVSIERTKHSEKPEFFREIIDTIYPEGKRIELFARKEVENWEAWGNQLNANGK